MLIPLLLWACLLALLSSVGHGSYSFLNRLIFQDMIESIYRASLFCLLQSVPKLVMGNRTCVHFGPCCWAIAGCDLTAQLTPAESNYNSYSIKMKNEWSCSRGANMAHHKGSHLVSVMGEVRTLSRFTPALSPDFGNKSRTCRSILDFRGENQIRDFEKSDRFQTNSKATSPDSPRVRLLLPVED